MNIAIYDDDIYFSGHIKEYLEEYLTSKGFRCRIDIFNSGEELLERGIVDCSIAFLDINMSGMDDLAIAQKIREYNSDIFIVFISDYIRYSLEGYKVNATRFILKDNLNFKESIYECMDAILEKMQCDAVKKTFRFVEFEKTVVMDRLMYIESKLHKLEFHVLEEKSVVYTMRSTLNELEKELSEFEFLRVHQSFLVNLKHIKKINGRNLILDNEEIIIIPKVRCKDVKDAFKAYKGKIYGI